MKFNSEKGNEAVSFFVCVSFFFVIIEFVMNFYRQRNRRLERRRSLPKEAQFSV